MTTAHLLAVPPVEPRVQLLDGLVYIRDLGCSDPALVSLLGDAGDEAAAEAAVQRVLSIGAQAMSVAHRSIDTTMVDQSFAVLHDRLRLLLDQTTEQVEGTTADLLHHPESGVASTLTTWRQEVTALLDATFDPDRSSSAIGRLDGVLQKAGDRHLAATRLLLNPDVGDSPLGRVLGGVREQVGTVLDAVARLAEQVAADRAGSAATAAALERSAVKGLMYEEQGLDVLTGIAAERGDVAEAVGRLGGSSGGKVGDAVVTVDPSVTAGQAGRYVAEFKDKRLSLAAALREIRQAMANREALAGIVVFSRSDHCPVPGPLTVLGDVVFVVLDKTDFDPLALRVACMWARAVVQRELGGRSADLDAEAVAALFQEARAALCRLTTIRRAHSGMRKCLDEASGQVAELGTEVTAALDRFQRAVQDL